MTNVVVARDCPAAPPPLLLPPSQPPPPPSLSPSTIRSSQPNRFLMESMRSTTRRPLHLFTDSRLPLGGRDGPASIVRRGGHVSVIGTAGGHGFCTRTNHRSATGGRRTRKSSCPDNDGGRATASTTPPVDNRYRLLLFFYRRGASAFRDKRWRTKRKLLRLIRLDYHERTVTARATSPRAVLSSSPFCYRLPRARTTPSLDFKEPLRGAR